MLSFRYTCHHCKCLITKVLVCINLHALTFNTMEMSQTADVHHPIQSTLTSLGQKSGASGSQIAPKDNCSSGESSHGEAKNSWLTFHYSCLSRHTIECANIGNALLVVCTFYPPILNLCHF